MPAWPSRAAPKPGGRASVGKKGRDGSGADPSSPTESGISSARASCSETRARKSTASTPTNRRICRALEKCRARANSAQRLHVYFGGVFGALHDETETRGGVLAHQLVH